MGYVLELLTAVGHGKNKDGIKVCFASHQACSTGGRDNALMFVVSLNVSTDYLVQRVFATKRFLNSSRLMTRKWSFFGGRIPDQKQERKE